MFVIFDSGGIARLEDPLNFRAFKVVCPSTLSNREASLSSIGRLDQENHLWVAQDWLESQGEKENVDWLAGLKGMVAYARSAGWVDQTGAIRAHVELT